MTRAAGRGVERLDTNTMQVLRGGVGDVPRDVGLRTRKTDFEPRVGVAWRVNTLTVLRTGYGLTYNPLPFARPLRGAYPLTIHNTYVSLNSRQPYGALATGIPEFGGPGPDEGSTPLPSMSIFRTFPIQGRVRLQFRVEGFSIANQPQWSNPNGSVTSGSFMRISSTRGDATTGGGARYVRFGVRLEF